MKSTFTGMRQTSGLGENEDCPNLAVINDEKLHASRLIFRPHNHNDLYPPDQYLY